MQNRITNSGEKGALAVPHSKTNFCNIIFMALIKLTIVTYYLVAYIQYIRPYISKYFMKS